MCTFKDFARDFTTALVMCLQALGLPKARLRVVVTGAVQDLTRMYLLGWLDDTNIDTSECSLYRDYADTASS